MHEEKDTAFAQMELSSAWLELLGQHRNTVGLSDEIVGAIPALASDPWSSLLRGGGVETVDLQKVHLPMNAQDVEQILQLMQEQSVQHPEQ